MTIYLAIFSLGLFSLAFGYALAACEQKREREERILYLENKVEDLYKRLMEKHEPPESLEPLAHPKSGCYGNSIHWTAGDYAKYHMLHGLNQKGTA